MKNLFLLIAVCAMVCACSTEDGIEQTPEAQLQEKNSRCSGFGIFSNTQYDCGWKRGYSDWVYHYNNTVRNLNYSPCNEIRIIRNGKTMGLSAGKTDASFNIIQLTQNNNQRYYEDLFKDLSTDFLKGKAAGYSAGRGQEPFSSLDNPECFNQGLGIGN